MVLDNLGSALKNTISKIGKALFVDEKLINELIKDLQRALLASDVNVKLVLELTNKIKKRALDEGVKTISKQDHLIKILYEEITNFLGGKEEKIDISKKPTKILLVGLFGNGKTTTAGKLAKYYQKRGLKVAMIGLDVHRPAAFAQLKQIGDSLNVPVFGNPNEKNALKIYEKFEPELKKYDVVLLDTAGRDALSDDLIEEINKLSKKANPQEKLLIIGADVGQAAEKQAQAFQDACGVTGVVITKMDGTAKGGGALIACSVTNTHVKFIGVGEKVDDFEKFNPEQFVGRLLGMGDLKGLLEKAKEAISEEKAEDLSKRLLKGEFNLIDLYDQMEAMNKMGSFGKIMEMVPGMGQIKLPKEALKVQEGKMKKWKHIIDSCTKNELEEPEKLNPSRIERIAKGSGTSEQEVRELLKQYKQSKKMVKMFKGGSPKNMQQMMKKFGGKIPKM